MYVYVIFYCIHLKTTNINIILQQHQNKSDYYYKYSLVANMEFSSRFFFLQFLFNWTFLCRIFVDKIPFCVYIFHQ